MEMSPRKEHKGMVLKKRWTWSLGWREFGCHNIWNQCLQCTQGWSGSQCNRGGLGLNAHNAHRTGAKVQSIAPDIKQLDTYLFTMPPAGKVAVKHIMFNEEQAGAPELLRLDKFAKKQAANDKLAEEYWTAVTEVSFGETSHCPRIRSAMLACNMTAPKVQDGISRLLVKGDIMRLASNDKLQSLLEFEKSLATCDDMVEQLGLTVDEKAKV